jgi:hypothetical protein
MLAVGVPRAVILAEFGAPVSTVKNGDETVDIFLLNKVMVRQQNLGA